ncbi:hypothetical protein YC2023_109891 [Brassica napus]
MATSQISLSELKAGRSSECEEKWSKSTCDSWMISNLSSKHLYRSISRTHSDNFLGRELCMKLETGVRRPTVMLAISINPKLVGGLFSDFTPTQAS